MITILCVKCNASFQIDETSISDNQVSINCPNCTGKIVLKPEQTKKTETSVPLAPCPECKSNVPVSSQNCPNCGYPIQRMLVANKEQAEVAFSNAKSFFKNNKFSRARESVLLALELSPNNSAYKELLNKIDLMVEAYRESKESFNNAESYCKKGAFTEALASIDEALKIFPNPDFETLRGQINKNIEAKKQADKLYEEANAALGKSEIKSAFVLILKAISLLPQIVKYNELKRQISKVYGEKLFEQAQNLFAEKDYKGCLETMTECLSVAPSHQKYLDFYIKVEKHQKKRVFIKRCIIFCFLVVILPITGLSIFHILKSNKDANAWVLAEKLNSIQSYYHYLTDYPNGNFSVFATTRICVINKYEEIAWNQAKQVDLIPVYSIFIKTYPNSSYVKKAQAYILTFNIRKWAGMYSSDEQYCNGENFKMEINASLSCTLRTLNGYTWKGKAEIDVDSVVIRFENTPIDDITQGKIYRSFARCNINRPAIILADLNGKLCTAFPQAFDENDRKAHIFFKKKQSNLRNVDPLMLLRYGRKNKSTVSMTHEYLIVKTQLKEIQIQKKILQMFSGNDNTHYLT